MIIALAAIGYNPLVAPACGPFFPEIIFTNTLHPDLPIGPYTAGELGVIQPRFSEIFLFVAYRNLADIPFSRADNDALWTGRPVLQTGKTSYQQAAQMQAQFGASGWIAQWASATGASPATGGAMVTPEGIFDRAMRPQGKIEFYSQFLNCPQDAFRVALVTLKRQRAQFGESSPAVKSWIGAQNQVFENCAGTPSIPSPLPAGASAEARADRAYQIAAAYFYAREYDKAADAFSAIAADASSPWSRIAPYLVARSLVRKATMGNPAGIDLSVLAQAEAQVEKVLANPRFAEYHQAAEQLRGFIAFRLHPRQRLVKLADELMQPRDPNLKQDSIDFTRLISRLQSGPTPGASPSEKYDANSYLAPARAQSDLIDWMLTMKSSPAAGFGHAVEKWEAIHSQAWLVAALTLAAPGAEQVSKLLRAAAAIPPSSPAYASTTFQSLRLLALQGRYGQVRDRLAHIESNKAAAAKLPRSTRNLLLALQLECATNLDEFIKFAPRLPATITSDSEPEDLPIDVGIWEENNPSLHFTDLKFDDDSLVVLNRYLPVSFLAQVASSRGLPENLKRETALAAWTRAALLGDGAVARAIGPEVERFAPQLKSGIEAYDRAEGGPAKRFAAALTFMRFPGLRPYITRPARTTAITSIDNYRDNWWRAGGPCQLNGQYWSVPELAYYYPPRPVPLWPQLRPVLAAIYPGGQVKPPAFLNTVERAHAANEWEQLTALGTAPDYLSQEVLAFAKAHPRDPRVPEALALAVRSTRFGCADQATGKLSSAAFALLHQRYPDTRWARETKYWYKN